MAKDVKIKLVGEYNGHSIKNNKSVDLKFIFPAGEMVNYIQLLQLLNENTTIHIKVGDEKPKKLGMFMLQNFSVDHDGELSVKFNSSLDYVEADNLNGLAGETIQVLFKARLEDADADEE